MANCSEDEDRFDWTKMAENKSTVAQNIICGIVLCFTPGIYVAVLNLGAGGGGADAAATANIVNACLYAIFGVTGFFGGSILNKIGPRWVMMIGAFGYPFYISGFWFYDYGGSSSNAYPIIAGCVLGICAALLWTASNFVCFCYSTEHQKGTFFFIQASLTAFGNLCAASVVLGFSINNDGLSGVSQVVYATFFSLTMLGVALALLLCNNPADVRREGSPIAIFKQATWLQELRGTFGLFRSLKIWLVMPLLMCCEIPLVLQGTISAYWFNVRTRALCIFIGPIFNVMATWALARLLDNKRLTRMTRAYAGLGTFLIFSAAAYAGELSWIHSLPPGTLTHANNVDWSEPGFPPFFVIFELFQICIAIAPMYCAWLIMTFTNDPTKVASYAGLIRSVGAIGGAIFFGVAASGAVTLPTEAAIHCACQIGTMIPIPFVIRRYVTSTNYETEKDIVVIPHSEVEIMPEIKGSSQIQETELETNVSKQ